MEHEPASLSYATPDLNRRPIPAIDQTVAVLTVLQSLFAVWVVVMILGDPRQTSSPHDRVEIVFHPGVQMTAYGLLSLIAFGGSVSGSARNRMTCYRLYAAGWMTIVSVSCILVRTGPGATRFDSDLYWQYPVFLSIISPALILLLIRSLNGSRRGLVGSAK